MSNLVYKVDPKVNYVFEEQGNQFNAFRKISWGEDSKTYYELRRWRNTPDGGEMPAKGMTFLTEDGPNELVHTLVDNDFGNTKVILESLSKRKDFQKSLNTVVGKKSEFYDKNVGSIDDDYIDPAILVEEF